MIEVGGLALFTTVHQILLDIRLELVEQEKVIIQDIKYSEGTSNIMITCPFHANGQEKNPSCGISTKTIWRNGTMYEPGTVNCFSCGFKANLFMFIAMLLGSNNEAVGRRWLVQKYNATAIEGRSVFEIPFKQDNSKVKYTYLNESVLDSYKYTSAYLYSRRFNDDTIEFFEFGYNYGNKTITIPVRDHTGGLVFIKQRFIIPPVGMDKYLNTPGIPKQYILYGFYHVLMLKQAIEDGTCDNKKLEENFHKYGVVITEGEFNAAYLWQNNMPAVSLLGRILFNEQMRLLLRNGIHSCILWMDNDKFGQEAQKIIKKKLNKIRLWQPDYNQFPQYNDANDFPSEDLVRLKYKIF